MCCINGRACEKSVPTELKKATTFLKDEHLKNIDSYSDQRYGYRSFPKNDESERLQMFVCFRHLRLLQPFFSQNAEGL